MRRRERVGKGVREVVDGVPWTWRWIDPPKTKGRFNVLRVRNGVRQKVRNMRESAILAKGTLGEKVIFAKGNLGDCLPLADKFNPRAER